MVRLRMVIRNRSQARWLIDTSEQKLVLAPARGDEPGPIATARPLPGGGRGLAGTATGPWMSRSPCRRPPRSPTRSRRSTRCGPSTSGLGPSRRRRRSSACFAPELRPGGTEGRLSVLPGTPPAQRAHAGEETRAGPRREPIPGPRPLLSGQRFSTLFRSSDTKFTRGRMRPRGGPAAAPAS